MGFVRVVMCLPLNMAPFEASQNVCINLFPKKNEKLFSLCRRIFIFYCHIVSIIVFRFKNDNDNILWNALSL